MEDGQVDQGKAVAAMQVSLAGTVAALEIAERRQSKTLADEVAKCEQKSARRASDLGSQLSALTTEVARAQKAISALKK